MLTLPKLIQTILKGSLTNFSDSKVVSGLNVTGNAFGKKRKLIESDHLRSLLQFVRDDLYPKNIVNLNGVPYYATTLKDTLRIKKTANPIILQAIGTYPERHLRNSITCVGKSKLVIIT